MFRTASIAFILICGHLPVHSMQWHVGPGQPYTAPSQVSGLVGNGDTVAIHVSHDR
ncbi:MAG: hypothetical protein IPO56_17090 [Flavobacteriales bacterium]|nr:hypothetical protein [Flavobacteriales bacterium]